MIVQNNRILEILLEADADPNDPQKQPNEKPDKPEGFEEDPMGFIIRKYEGLNVALTELMSKDYKQYLTAIFLVAPKPTTFKIVLHNGQYFFMTYMGKKIAGTNETDSHVYEANIAGKRFYLDNIGIKERAMNAITRLLKFGAPLKTKGPEGAEESTRPEGESEIGGGETGGNEAPEETGAEQTGGEESLKESNMRIDILRSLLRSENKIYDRIDQKIINILIKEAVIAGKPKLISLKNTLQNQLNQSGFEASNSSKKGTHIRVNLGTSENAEDVIANELAKINKEKFYKIQAIQPKDFANGAKSSSTYTYKIEVIKPTQEFEKGEIAYLVNQAGDGKTITPKSLTPGKFGLPGHSFTDENDLVKYVKSKLPSVTKDKQLITVLGYLLDDVAKNTATRFKNVSDIVDDIDEPELEPKTIKLLSTFSSADLNVIGKDFGEILGAVAMLKSVEDAGTGIEFPPGENNPLTDFSIDGYAISSKYQQGAAAALTDITKGLNPKKLRGRPDQLELYDILLNIVNSDSTIDSYVDTAKRIESRGIVALSKIFDVPIKQINAKYIIDVMNNDFSGKTNAQKDKILNTKYAPFYEAIGRSVGTKNKPLDWAKIGDKYFGLVISPLAYNVADDLNSNPEYKNPLKQMLSKLEVKQLYLDFKLAKNYARFKLKSFKAADFKFMTSVSSDNPGNSKLAFKVIV
jgi:hypothetical protein